MNIEDKVKKTFDVLETIEVVKTPPFFKDKVMQRLYAEKEETQTVWLQLMPHFQLTLVLIVVALNVFALTRLDLNTNTDDIDEFVQTYDLSASEFEYKTLFN